ncbi:MAG TPA: hypothetical protein DDW42_02495 [Desulfobacteraceae bacterium]|nr:hypothetical protein [Desulfobacteraceae bacterium]
MRRKKLPKNKKLHPPSLLASEEVLVTSLLQNYKNAEPAELAARIKESCIARGLVDRLPLNDKSDIPLLSAIYESFEDKQVRKAVKRALFKLKKRGLSPENFSSAGHTARSILKPPQKDKHEAYVGPIDAMGNRAVFMSLYRSIKGVDSVIGLVSDEYGIQQFLFGNFSKKRTIEMKGFLSEEAGPLVWTSLSHCTSIIESSYQHHLEIHSEPPADYLEVRPWLLEHTNLPDRPVIYNFISETSAPEETLTDSQLEKLFNHSLLESWLIDFKKLKPFIEEIQNIDESVIVLTDLQKSDQVRHIKERITRELFPDPMRGLWKHRFEEMAYVFFKLGEDEYSLLSLVAARIMGAHGTAVLGINPVIEFLIDRSHNFYMDAAKGYANKENAGDEPPARIILP